MRKLPRVPVARTSLRPCCYACHRKEDGTKGVLGEKCETCHAEKKWKTVSFEHARDSALSLRAKHQQVKCDSCHKARFLATSSRRVLRLSRARSTSTRTSSATSARRCHTERAGTKPLSTTSESRFPLLERHARRRMQEMSREPGIQGRQDRLRVVPREGRLPQGAARPALRAVPQRARLERLGVRSQSAHALQAHRRARQDRLPRLPRQAGRGQDRARDRLRKLPRSTTISTSKPTARSASAATCRTTGARSSNPLSRNRILRAAAMTDPSLPLTYVAPLSVVLSVYVLSRRRREARAAATLRRAVKTGLTEPPSLHPVIDPRHLCRLRRLHQGLPGRHPRHRQRQGAHGEPDGLHRTWRLRGGLSGGGDQARVRHRAPRHRHSLCQADVRDQRARHLHRGRTRRHGTDTQGRRAGAPGDRSRFPAIAPRPDNSTWSSSVRARPGSRPRSRRWSTSCAS